MRTMPMNMIAVGGFAFAALTSAVSASAMPVSAASTARATLASNAQPPMILVLHGCGPNRHRTIYGDCIIDNAPNPNRWNRQQATGWGGRPFRPYYPPTR